MKPLLEIRALQAGYPTSQVLFGIDLAVHEGEVATLLGRNGMGKTTTLRTLFGLTQRLGGEISFAGARIDGLPTHAIAQRGIALVPEGRQIFPNLTVRENLIAFARPRSGSHGGGKRGASSSADSGAESSAWTLARVYELLPRLAERGQLLGSQLSGGEQQMLAIGRALLTNPRLLILDEATEGLSPLLRDEIWACLRRLRTAGLTILLIDKYVEKLVALADTHTIIEKGRVAWRGSSAALASERMLWQRFLGVA